MFRKIIQNQKGAIAVMMTLLILSSILTITMISNTIIVNNLGINIIQVGATKAFFASEAGAEKILWEVRRQMPVLDFTPTGIDCSDGQNICFTGNNLTATSSSCVLTSSACTLPKVKNLTLTNGASFSLVYEQPIADATTTITSSGIYNDTARNTQIQY